MGIVNHAAEAEDVVQEVFIKLWDKHREGEIQNWEAWCLTAAKNLSIDKLRSRHQRLQPIQAGFDLQDSAATPLQATIENDVFAQVKKLMNALPQSQRDIMQLRDIEGMSYQEIADALSLSLDQVRVYLFRARKAVREGLMQLT